MLSDFFRINLPYGIKKNEANEWFAFNREYMPLGWNSKVGPGGKYGDSSFTELPVYTKYKGLTESKLLKLAHSEAGVHRNEAGEITMVFFYNDATNPQNDSKRWPDYFERLKLISSCEVSKALY